MTALALLVSLSFAAVERCGAAATVDPRLDFTVTEIVADGEGRLAVHVRLADADRLEPELFAPAPRLPPCGRNEAAPRSWLNVCDAGEQRLLFGHCAIERPARLSAFVFGLGAGKRPKSVWLELWDRERNERIRSNAVQLSYGGVAERRPPQAAAPPRRLKHVAPEYPESMRRAKRSARLVLSVLIRDDGSVEVERLLQCKDPEVERDPEYCADFLPAARTAVEQWRYDVTAARRMAVVVDFTTN